MYSVLVHEYNIFQLHAHLILSSHQCRLHVMYDVMDVISKLKGKETEIQPGLEPGSSKLRSDALTTELLD